MTLKFEGVSQSAERVGETHIVAHPTLLELPISSSAAGKRIRLSNKFPGDAAAPWSEGPTLGSTVLH